MKRSHLIAFFVLIVSVSFFSDVFAQGRIAFVNSDRTAILAKKVGGKLDTLFTTKILQADRYVKLRNLSVLASTRDGKSLLIAGVAIFLNQISGTLDSAAAFARIDSPFTNTGLVEGLANPLRVGGATILKFIFSPEITYTKALPLGTLSSDGTEWWGTWSKAQGGDPQQIFYHGKFTGLGSFDSVKLTGSDAPSSGYHMTNIAVSEDNKTMLTVIFDKIIQNLPPRARLLSWTPGISGAGVPLQAVEFTSLIKKPDSVFAFFFRVLPQTQQGIILAELGLGPANPAKITLYQLRIINSGVTALTSSSRTILRSALPTDIHFFIGNTNNPGSDFDDRETVVPTRGHPFGNGGDIMPSFGGDSVVFVTCNKSDQATAAESGIYIYDLRTNIATLVQNDVTKMERQPIFMGSVPKAVPYKVGTAVLDKTSIDFGKHFIGDPDAVINVLLTDNTNSLVKVTSAAISGADQANFTVTPGAALPATVQGQGTLNFAVKFHPTAEKDYSATLTIHYVDSLDKKEKDSILTIPITGIGAKNLGVKSTASSFDLSVVPNPFTSSTQINIVAREGGSTSLEIRDLLGKDIYSSKSLTLGAGEKFTYTFDAKALHLVPGTYFVIVRSAGDELTRQVIYLK